MTDGDALRAGLRPAAARVALAAFVVVHLVLVIGSATPVLVLVLAVILATAAAGGAVLPSGSVLPRRTASLAAAWAAASAALIVPRLPHEGWPGYAAWPLGAATFVAIALAIRGRVGTAWTLMAALTMLCVGWGTSGGEVLAGVGLIVRQIAVLLVGTLFAVGLARASRAVEGFSAVRRRRVIEEQVATTEFSARQHLIDRVLADAGPTLDRIAAGESFDAVERAAMLALEARLRDRIALAPLLSDSLDAALEAARARGVDAVVMTEPAIGDLPTSSRLKAADWIASRLDRARGSEFVGRAVVRGSALRVSSRDSENKEETVIDDPVIDGRERGPQP